jgi:hypothetical protein
VVGTFFFFRAENEEASFPAVSNLSKTVSKRRESMIVDSMVSEIHTIFALIGIHLHMNNWDFHVTLFAVGCLNPM